MRLTTFLTTMWGRDGRTPRNRFVASVGGNRQHIITLPTLLTPPSAVCTEQYKSFPLPRCGADTTDPTDQWHKLAVPVAELSVSTEGCFEITELPP